MRYIIETRRPVSDDRPSETDWVSDCLGDPMGLIYPTREEAQEAIDALRQLGDEWATAGYRVREMRTDEVRRRAPIYPMPDGSSVEASELTPARLVKVGDAAMVADAWLVSRSQAAGQLFLEAAAALEEKK